MRSRSNRRALPLLFALTLSACHAAPRPAAAPVLPAAGSPARLQRDIDAALAAPALEHASWGILVRSLKNNDTLYSLNPGKLLMPGSAMKVATLAAAAERLGWDYAYETRLAATGPIEAGVLHGDLVVVGSGDPSLVERDAMAARVFADWTAALKANGIRAIAGRIVGDDRAFDDEGLGPGWAWDDLGEGFAAPVSALQFNENAAGLTIAPGRAVDGPASVTVSPAASGLLVRNLVRTAPSGVAVSIEARRLPGRTGLEVRGSIPVGSRPVDRVVSVENPTLFFVSALRDALVAGGIEVRGSAVDIDDVMDAPPSPGGAVLVTYRSPPLGTLAATMMKASQNLYAETLLKTLGALTGAPTTGAGRSAAGTALRAWGVMPGELIQVDGSGLSRYNYVTPEALVTILTHVDRDARLRDPFEAALPVAGRDGTLAARMKGTRAEGNARAKTGTLANVRALTGYVTSADGEPLVFAVTANNFGAAPGVAVAAIDAIVVRLAEFHR